MFFLFLAATYAVLLPLGWGILLLRFIRRCLRLTEAEEVAALTTWLGGLLLLTVLLEVWSLVGPVHTAAHLVAATGGVIGLWQPAGRQLLRHQWRRAGQLHPLVRVLAGLLVLCALVVASMPSPNIDTGVYHAQSLHWLEEMGVVPGLANIDIHIGFNSAWFVPEALFSWGRYVGSPLQVLNGVFFVLFGWYCLAGLDRILRNQPEPVDFMRVLLLAMMFRLLNDLASLSPDPAVTLLLFYLVLQGLLLPWPRPGQPLLAAQVVVILLSIFAVTLKLSTMPVLLLAVWWCARARLFLNGRFLAVTTVLVLAVVVPWLVRNVLISGYLVFPVAIDLFNPTWKFPLAELRLHSDYIKEFARNKDFYGQIVVLNQPLSVWVPVWWRQQHLDSQAILLAIPTLLLLSLPLGGWLYRRQRLPVASRALLLVTLGGVAFWFGLAPAFRFGYGFLFTTLALLLMPWLWVVGQRYARLLGLGFALVTLGLLVATPLQVDYHHYLIPPSLSQAEYASLLRRLPAPADQAFLRREYPVVRHDTLWYEGEGPALEHARLVLLLGSVDGVPGRSGLDGSGRSGFAGFAQRLVWPAPYPRVAVQPLVLPPVRVLQSQHDEAPWYAPFPFVRRRQLCAARGPRLADGFVARVLPGIRDWRKEARW